MNWEMLAAIGQLAAMFVGIPSLIYLATQIREQTKERRQSAVHALTVQWGDLTEPLHDNAESASIFHRGMQSFADLDAVSKLRFIPGVQQWWETRRHWHTEEFGQVVGEIIAKGNEPKAFSTYNLREITKPVTSDE